MTAFPEDRTVDHIVDAIQRLGGRATLEEIEEQLSRSGAMRLPLRSLDLVVRMTIRANRDGRGLGCFSQLNGPTIGLTSRRSSVLPSGVSPGDGGVSTVPESSGRKPAQSLPVR